MSFASPRKHNQNIKFLPKRKGFSNTNQTLAIAGFAMLFLISGSVTIFFMLSFFSSRHNASYPTSLPWVESKSQCEEFGRTWRNDQCWDEEHSHDF
ncbi:MAG: hypothetical protein QNJ51_21130 [Calothrix sp. MO_167.B12]|nr:hypothetical protein [Calothrix sp. MO_167.B12]